MHRNTLTITTSPGSTVDPVICIVGRESIDQLVAIDQESSPTPWHREGFYNEFDKDHSTTWGARFNGKIVGFLICHLLFDQAHIMNFAVLPEYRRQRIGTTLLIRALQDLYQDGARQVVLEVRYGNNSARQLYRSIGFSEEAIRDSYYSDNNEDAVFMRLDLLGFIDSKSR